MPHPFPLGLEGTGKTKIRAMTHDDDKNEASNRAATTKQNTTEFSDLLDECPLQPMKNSPFTQNSFPFAAPGKFPGGAPENFPILPEKIFPFDPQKIPRSPLGKCPGSP